MPVSIPSAIYDTSAIGTAQTRFSIYDDGAGRREDGAPVRHRDDRLGYDRRAVDQQESITGIPVNLPKYKKTTIVPPYALSSAEAL